MFKWLKNWLSSSTVPAQPEEKTETHWLTHQSGPVGFSVPLIEALRTKINGSLPQAAPGTAMDDSSTGMPGFKTLINGNPLPDNLAAWYASQSFIGHQFCAIVAQHWLVDKACTMPARDAIRHGYDIHVWGLPAPEESLELDLETPTDREEDDEETKLVKEIREKDKRYRVRKNMEEFVRMGRVFGIRVLFFKVESADPKYYEKPFNPDGITPGSFKGIVQVDPYWCVPMLDGDDAANPASEHFYEPTWWTVNGKRYHRSHLIIFRNSPPPDILKPMYMYGGVPVPQKILERVYAAERTANEAPQLAMTKRTLVWNTDVASFLANQENALKHMANWTQYRDNYGVKIVDGEDTMTAIDTNLADLDEVIMTQYQIVAAAANVPATKLLGTTPKGFNSSGEYEESNYHEELEAIQANDLTDLLDRYHTMLLRSEIEPARSLEPGTLSLTVDWAPVDSPTAKEYAEINKLKSETDAQLVNAGAIDGMDVRNRLKRDPNSDYTGLADVQESNLLGDLGLGTSEETTANTDPANLGGATRPSNIPGLTA